VGSSFVWFWGELQQTKLNAAKSRTNAADFFIGIKIKSGSAQWRKGSKKNATQKKNNVV
jgi:hypothetical protein